MGMLMQESFKARVDASAGEMASLQWQLKEREAEVREAATKLEELERNSRESIATRDTLLNDLRVKVVKQDEQIAGLEANANNAQRLMAEKKCEVRACDKPFNKYGASFLSAALLVSPWL
jgi:chromosome segregation ATPase